jgi:hypothetical protein
MIVSGFSRLAIAGCNDATMKINCAEAHYMMGRNEALPHGKVSPGERVAAKC